MYRVLKTRNSLFSKNSIVSFVENLITVRESNERQSVDLILDKRANLLNITTSFINQVAGAESKNQRLYNAECNVLQGL